MNRPAGIRRIAVLDADHVIRLAAALLRWAATDQSYAREFFSPQAVNPTRLAAITSELRQEWRLEIVDASDDWTAAAGADALLFRRGRVSAELIAACPGLRLIQRLGSDPSGIDPSALDRAIPVSCLTRYSLVHVAEHTLFLMLALARRWGPCARAISNPTQAAGTLGQIAYNWAGLSGFATLQGRTLGLVGLGEIGTLVARRASAFGMRLLYTARSRVPGAREAELGIAYRPLEALMAEADIVSVHVPLNAGTAALIGRREIERMKPGAFLVNTSRGALIDEEALRDALASGLVGGAALDVHAAEPRDPADPLLDNPNVILTPHIAGGERDVVLAEIRAIAENLAAVFGGAAPRHGVVNVA